MDRFREKLLRILKGEIKSKSTTGYKSTRLKRRRQKSDLDKLAEKVLQSRGNNNTSKNWRLN